MFTNVTRYDRFVKCDSRSKGLCEGEKMTRDEAGKNMRECCRNEAEKEHNRKKELEMVREEPVRSGEEREMRERFQLREYRARYKKSGEKVP